MTKEENKALEYFKALDKLTFEPYISILLRLIDKQQKEIEFYSKQELSYIAGYQDGKNHKQTAVAFRVENAQQELFQREIARYKDKIEQQQKEIEELKENISAFTDKKLKNIINNQQKEIEELKKELKRQGNVREIEEEFIEKNYISKNKIKEIIEKHYPDVARTKLNELLEE